MSNAWVNLRDVLDLPGIGIESDQLDQSLLTGLCAGKLTMMAEEAQVYAMSLHSLPTGLLNGRIEQFSNIVDHRLNWVIPVTFWISVGRVDQPFVYPSASFDLLAAIESLDFPSTIDSILAGPAKVRVAAHGLKVGRAALEAWLGVPTSRRGGKIQTKQSETVNTTVHLKPIPEAELKRWFLNCRIPDLGDGPPPRWQECWQAAKEHYAGRYLITRDMLQFVRREVAPGWRPGRRH